MPDCVALAIETPRGVVIDPGDFKVDQTPLDGDPMDVPRLAELGGQSPCFCPVLRSAYLDQLVFSTP